MASVCLVVKCFWFTLFRDTRDCEHLKTDVPQSMAYRSKVAVLNPKLTLNSNLIMKFRPSALGCSADGEVDTSIPLAMYLLRHDLSCSDQLRECSISQLSLPSRLGNPSSSSKVDLISYAARVSASPARHICGRAACGERAEICPPPGGHPASGGDC